MFRAQGCCFPSQTMVKGITLLFPFQTNVQGVETYLQSTKYLNVSHIQLLGHIHPGKGSCNYFKVLFIVLDIKILRRINQGLRPLFLFLTICSNQDPFPIHKKYSWCLDFTSGLAKSLYKRTYVLVWGIIRGS